MKIEVNPFSAPWMVFWKMSWFVHNFLQNFHVVPKVYSLSRSYLDCLWYLRFFSILCPNCALGALRYCNVCSSIHKAKKDFLFLRHRGIRFFHPAANILFKEPISSKLILFKNIWRFFVRPTLAFVFFSKKSARETEDKVFWPNRKHFILYFKLKSTNTFKNLNIAEKVN